MLCSPVWLKGEYWSVKIPEERMCVLLLIQNPGKPAEWHGYMVHPSRKLRSSACALAWVWCKNKNGLSIKQRRKNTYYWKQRLTQSFSVLINNHGPKRINLSGDVSINLWQWGQIPPKPYSDQIALSLYQLPKILTPMPKQTISFILPEGRLMLWNKLYCGGNLKC